MSSASSDPKTLLKRDDVMSTCVSTPTVPGRFTSNSIDDFSTPSHHQSPLDPPHLSDISNHTYPRHPLHHKPLALLQQPVNLHRHILSRSQPHPTLHFPTSAPTPSTTSASPLYRQAIGQPHAITSAPSVAAHQWPMFSQSMNSGMGGLVADYPQGVKRARTHQRTPSTSTVGSNGPASPFPPTLSYQHPHIVNPDFSPNSPPSFHQDSKNLAIPPQLTLPVDSAASTPVTPMSSAHLAMKDFGMDHHLAENRPTGSLVSQQSNSSAGNDSPETPHSLGGDFESNQSNLMPTGKTGLIGATSLGGDYSYYDTAESQKIRLHRTESEAYQDELYMPTIYKPSSTIVHPTSNKLHLSPRNRNLVSERLQNANLARSKSPNTSSARAPSPYEDAAQMRLGAGQAWKAPAAPISTAASLRRQQKEAAEQAELRAHEKDSQSQNQEAPTISPKDAFLSYPNDSNPPPLFNDTPPNGYHQHTGGTEQWTSNNNFFGQPTSFVSNMGPDNQPGFTFRAASDDAYSDTSFLDFPIYPPEADQAMPVQTKSLGPTGFHAKANNEYVDSPPEFPAALPSMETSMSDLVPTASQDSASSLAPPQRPTETRANTGAYTCTYHNCTRRFDSSQSLMKHKREVHRVAHATPMSTMPTVSTPQSRATSSTGTKSVSPLPPDSPASSSGTGMTSAAILARNSQAGPHKCTRINPSTGKPCNTVFSRPYDLTRHEDTIHNNRKHKVRCPICNEDKTFSRNDALTRHMRVVHPEVEPYGKRAAAQTAPSRRGD